MLLPMMWPRPAATPSGLPERSSVTGTTWRWVMSQLGCFCVLSWTNLSLFQVSHRLSETEPLVKGSPQEEASTAAPEVSSSTLWLLPELFTSANALSPIQASVAQGIWKMTFYTPEPVSLLQREAAQAGYSSMVSSKRLVVRSPYNTPETYSEDVSDVWSLRIFHLLQLVKWSSCVGGWGTNGGLHGQCLLQSPTWLECGEHGGSLSHRWAFLLTFPTF